MRLFIGIVILFVTVISTAHGQSDFISISKRVTVGWTKDTTKKFQNEIKINVHTGEVYFRKNTSKKFKIVSYLKNDTLIKKSITKLSFDKLDSLINESAFAITVFKFEFIHEDSYPNLPCVTTVKMIEFGYPHDQNNFELLSLLNDYYLLIDKIKKKKIKTTYNTGL